MSKICKNCDSENLDDAKFCRKCGKDDFNIEDKKNSEIIIAKNLEKQQENKSNVTMDTSVDENMNYDNGNFFFDSRDEPKFLFLISFWLSFFAALILLEQQGIL